MTHWFVTRYGLPLRDGIWLSASVRSSASNRLAIGATTTPRDRISFDTGQAHTWHDAKSRSVRDRITREIRQVLRVRLGHPVFGARPDQREGELKPPDEDAPGAL